ncbi:hypothetical protein [Cyanobium sp. Morenito 9A2]|uniref:hypothetical protein n=1 Tax=Cyanobium sp. Morenito 9A2 TaxID=2823718 RepID=UPI0020CEC21B|nr:hypothetical protein [Cyanobium sp. Morenito 9A2]MCP9849733.1 hypothetical protein [Cyanobium sp. Morenito 9A2]
MPLGVGVRLWFHEFGHAMVASWSGRRALPLPIGWTSADRERSVLVVMLVLLLELVLLTLAWRERRAYMALLACSLIATQLAAVVSLGGKPYAPLMAWGGVAGEFVLPTILITGGLFSVPTYFRWPLLRFPAVLGGSLTFW